MKDETISGKVVVVTGAGRGIGRALAVGFAEQGACVACLARSVGELDDAVRSIAGSGGRALAVPCDVTDLGAVERAYERATREFGGLDIVIVNAGVNNVRDAVGEDDPVLWRNTLEVNLFGAYHCMRAGIPELKKRGGGKIIALGSGRGRRGDPSSSSYACSKAALWMLVRVVAEELRPFDIAVNELVPGPVDTDMNRKFAGGKKDSLFTEGTEWVKRPEDVVPLALFMAGLPKRGPTAQAFSLARREF